MLNYLWIFMVTVGIAYGAATGHIADVNSALISSGNEAITLSISMMGILCIWSGLMEAAKKGGLTTQLTRLLKPFIKFLFPDVPPESDAADYIGLYITANILGLGWACTPFGVSAMKELNRLNNYSEKASPAMCDLMILSISSLQLIPVTVIAYRSQYGATNPTDIMTSVLISTSISTIAAIIFIKLMSICRRYFYTQHVRERS